jgi:hypothetical protein
MRALAIVLAILTTNASGAAQAQTTTPNVVNPTPGLSTPLTFTTTTCMMTCNSQAANCNAGCFVPPPPINAPGASSEYPPAWKRLASSANPEHNRKHGLPDGLYVSST